MSQRYPVPAQQHRVEEEIQRSLFITTIAPAQTVAEAQAFMAAIREEFADATHNCWAYVAGPPGSSAHVGMSDDGEPHGTAGKPMLTVLNHCGVGDIAAVVTRYYGGTKLGKGGLVRAYSGGVQLALESLPTKEKVNYKRTTLLIGYSYVTQLQQIMSDHEVEILNENYETDVTYQLNVPDDRWTDFESIVVNLTNGEAMFE